VYFSLTKKFSKQIYNIVTGLVFKNYQPVCNTVVHVRPHYKKRA